MIKAFDYSVQIPTIEFKNHFFAEHLEGYQSVYKDIDVFLDLVERPFDDFIQLMTDEGIEKAIIHGSDVETTFFTYFPNDEISKIIKRYPDKFLGFAGVDPNKGMKAVRELERSVKELGLCGVNIQQFENKLKPNDKMMYPIYSKCVELDIPIALHASQHFANTLPLEYSRPLYIDEVACDFPELKIIAAPPGWPWVEELLSVAWRHENVYISITPIRPKYIGKKNTGWETLLEYGNNILKDKIIFGTCWPLIPFKRSIEEVMDLPLKEEVKELWLYGNAKRLFKL